MCCLASFLVDAIGLVLNVSIEIILVQTNYTGSIVVSVL